MPLVPVHTLWILAAGCPHECWLRRRVFLVRVPPPLSQGVCCPTEGASASLGEGRFHAHGTLWLPIVMVTNVSFFTFFNLISSRISCLSSRSFCNASLPPPSCSWTEFTACLRVGAAGTKSVDRVADTQRKRSARSSGGCVSSSGHRRPLPRLPLWGQLSPAGKPPKCAVVPPFIKAMSH